MAAPGARMRLAVLVEALAEENAIGQHREEALEVFKERKFAMPVQLEDTFETVWNDIEQRYKTNYLDARQAATFSIKKLQDAYDCDLDMTDTVGAIFENEPDRKLHMIKVIPHFIYRETSVVPGSMLRPSGAQKRLGDDIDEGANKRRRVESQQRQDTQEMRDPSPNRPIPSTESRQAVAEAAGDVEAVRQSARSRSGMSLVELSRMETGQAPFSSTGVKQESPAPEQSPALNGIEAALPDESTGRSTDPVSNEPPQTGQSLQPRSKSPHEELQEAPQQLADNEAPEEEQTSPGATQVAPELAASPELDSQEAAIQKSPVSSVDGAPALAPAAKKRTDIYQIPSSPEFMQKKATPEKSAKSLKTYGRSPRSAQVIQREVDLVNAARLLPRSGKGNHATQNGTPVSASKKARAFQRPEPDEIESTPQEAAGSGQREKSHVTNDEDADEDDADLTASFLDEAAQNRPNGTQTPARKALAKPAKPGSLKKPSRAALMGTPAKAKQGVQSKAATPISRPPANKSGLKGTSSTPASTEPAKITKPPLSQETTSKMEYLQKLFSASQNNPKRKGNDSSPAQSGRSSPEVRISVVKKAGSIAPKSDTINARLAAQPPVPSQTPVRSPVPLPPSIRKSTPISSARPNCATETPKTGRANVFKKPAVKARETSKPSPPVKKATISSPSITPRCSEVPLPVNVRNLRRSSSLQSSPLANGDNKTSGDSPSAPAAIPEDSQKADSSTEAETAVISADEHDEPASTAKSTNGAIVISSAESSSAGSSNSEDEQQHDQATGAAESTVKEATSLKSPPKSTQADATRTYQVDTAHEVAVEAELEQPDEINEHKAPLNSHIALTQTQDKPPSGQGTSQAAPWGAESWGFGALDRTNSRSDPAQHTEEAEPQALAPVADPVSEDEGFVEQEMYSTAIEDNTSRSRSASAAASTRSSPAVKRRPARFLSHSPTPDASESEDDSDEVPTALARAASPQANDKDESESSSSSDSSEDEDVEMPDLPAGSTTDSNAKAVPPSSPPLDTTSNSTPVVPESSQFATSHVNHRTQRTPAPPPTQRSSQVPGSSQSVSVQAADRRRYAGFRSLREQLADTKAAQATTQKKTFDPRTMSLSKLAKGKPLVGFGGDDDDSSDDESSSSSDSD